MMEQLHSKNPLGDPWQDGIPVTVVRYFGQLANAASSFVFQ